MVTSEPKIAYVVVTAIIVRRLLETDWRFSGLYRRTVGNRIESV